MRLRCMRSQVVRKIDAFPAWFEGEFDSNEQVALQAMDFAIHILSDVRALAGATHRLGVEDQFRV